MQDLLVPLLTEAPALSHELLDVLLKNLVPSGKTSGKAASQLTRDILQRCADHLENFITDVCATVKS